MTTADEAATWRTDAACRGLPTSLFFPAPGISASAGLAVCARCSVRAECDDYACTNGEEHGIWGGRTEGERNHADELDVAHVRGVPRRPGPAPMLSDDELVELVRLLDDDQPAAGQLIARLGVSIPTAYKYLHRAKRLGVIEQRGRQLYPAS